MRKVSRTRTSPPMSKAQQNKTLLHKLLEAAKEARARVSTYSDDRRSDLEKLARGMISSAKSKQVCGN